MKKQRREKGQVLVLIILAIVGMLGFAALAIDLGRVFAERRRAQSAADSAVLAAANAGASYGNYMTAAVSQLGLNDYTDPTINVDDGQKIEIEVHSPPTSGAYNGVPGYYQVLIHEQVDKVLSQFVFPGLLKFTVEAVANVTVSESVGGANALAALSPTSCNALDLAGSGTNSNGIGIVIYGGGAYSRSAAGGVGSSCPAGNGNPGCSSAKVSGAGTVLFDPGFTIVSHGPTSQQGSGGLYTNTSPPTTVAPNDCNPNISLVPVLPAPICDPDPGPPTATLRSDGSGYDIIYSPGTYPNGIKVDSKYNGKNSFTHLNPGLYCLNQDLSMNTGFLTGKDVMFYMAGGSFQITGGTVNLYAWTDHKGAVGYPDFQWGGMLLYMPPSNLGEVHLGGNGSSQYTGTIFAPGPRPTEGQTKCILDGGGGSVGFASSIQCYTIQVTGSHALTLIYNAAANFHFPPNMGLQQ